MKGAGVTDEGGGQAVVREASPLLPLPERSVLVAKHA
jgi:hypothetical protein